MASKVFEAFPRLDKAACLPITRMPYGFVQRSSYLQLDRHHEEVVELESPLAAVVASGTRIFTFLLLGDQNAGKSTFLHSFTFHQGDGFLQLTSLLPMLSSSFVNTRFLPSEATIEEAMDQAPFIDTDVGRAVVLVSREDFLFFLEENGLHDVQQEMMSNEDIFVVLQFIEVGGDHLDRLIAFEQQVPMSHDGHSVHEEQLPFLSSSSSASSASSTSSSSLNSTSEEHLHEILQQTSQLVRTASKSIYFINGADFLRPASDEQLNIAHFSRLLSRIDYLKGVLGTDHSIVFNVSRVGEGNADEELQPSCRQALQAAFDSSAIAKKDGRSLSLPPCCTAISALESALQTALARSHVGFEGVTAFQLVGSGTGELDPTAIIDAVIMFFRRKLVASSSSDPRRLVAKYMFDSYRQFALRERAHFGLETPDGCTSQEEDLEMSAVSWMSVDEFHEFLDDEDHHRIDFELPTFVLLQRFESTALGLAKHGLALIHAADMHAPMTVLLEDRVLWSTVAQPSKQAASSICLVRFPSLSSQLVDLLQVFLQHDVPGDVWLDDDLGIRAQRTDQFVERCRAAARDLVGSIARCWERMDGASQVQKQIEIHRFIWLLEEWVMCSRLADRQPDQKLVLCLPLRLRCSESTMSSFPLRDQQEYAVGHPVVQINLDR